MKIRHIAMAVAVALGSSYAIADTSSAIRGRISNPQGEAAAGTKVIILHVPSGTSRTVVTNESGSFVASGLRVGGPYKVIVDSDTYNDETVNDVDGAETPVDTAADAGEPAEAAATAADIAIAEAAALNERLAGWRYRIPAYQYSQMTRTPLSRCRTILTFLLPAIPSSR